MPPPSTGRRQENVPGAAPLSTSPTPTSDQFSWSNFVVTSDVPDGSRMTATDTSCGQSYTLRRAEFDALGDPDTTLADTSTPQTGARRSIRVSARAVVGRGWGLSGITRKATRNSRVRLDYPTFDSVVIGYVVASGQPVALHFTGEQCGDAAHDDDRIICPKRCFDARIIKNWARAGTHIIPHWKAAHSGVISSLKGVMAQRHFRPGPAYGELFTGVFDEIYNDQTPSLPYADEFGGKPLGSTLAVGFAYMAPLLGNMRIAEAVTDAVSELVGSLIDRGFMVNKKGAWHAFFLWLDIHCSPNLLSPGPKVKPALRRVSLGLFVVCFEHWLRHHEERQMVAYMHPLAWINAYACDAQLHDHVPPGPSLNEVNHLLDANPVRSLRAPVDARARIRVHPWQMPGTSMVPDRGDANHPRLLKVQEALLDHDFIFLYGLPSASQARADDGAAPTILVSIPAQYKGHFFCTWPPENHRANEPCLSMTAACHAGRARWRLHARLRPRTSPAVVVPLPVRARPLVPPQPAGSQIALPPLDGETPISQHSRRRAAEDDDPSGDTGPSPPSSRAKRPRIESAEAATNLPLAGAAQAPLTDVVAGPIMARIRAQLTADLATLLPHPGGARRLDVDPLTLRIVVDGRPMHEVGADGVLAAHHGVMRARPYITFYELTGLYLKLQRRKRPFHSAWTALEREWGELLRAAQPAQTFSATAIQTDITNAQEDHEHYLLLVEGLTCLLEVGEAEFLTRWADMMGAVAGSLGQIVGHLLGARRIGALRNAEQWGEIVEQLGTVGPEEHRQGRRVKRAFEDVTRGLRGYYRPDRVDYSARGLEPALPALLSLLRLLKSLQDEQADGPTFLRDGLDSLREGGVLFE